MLLHCGPHYDEPGDCRIKQRRALGRQRANAKVTLDIGATFAQGATTADYIFGCSDILPRSAVKLVLEVDPSVVTSTTLEKTDLRVSWGQWPGVADPTVSGGTYRTSNTANDQAIYRIKGKEVSWITRKPSLP